MGCGKRRRLEKESTRDASSMKGSSVTRDETKRIGSEDEVSEVEGELTRILLGSTRHSSRATTLWRVQLQRIEKDL